MGSSFPTYSYYTTQQRQTDRQIYSYYTTNGDISYKLMENIFKKYKHYFNELLKLTNVEDLYSVVDLNNNGFLD